MSTIAENKQQYNPANATVVNLGVSFLHLRDTENIEKPKAEIKRLGKHPQTGEELIVKSGRYGPYINNGKINANVNLNEKRF